MSATFDAFLAYATTHRIVIDKNEMHCGGYKAYAVSSVAGKRIIRGLGETVEEAINDLVTQLAARRLS